MEIRDHIGSIVLLQLFWFSIPLIGFAAHSCYRRLLGRCWPVRYRSSYLTVCHPLVSLLLSFALGLGVLAIIIVPGYVCSLSTTTIEISYVVALALSLGWHAWHLRQYVAQLRAWQWGGISTLIWAFIIIFLGFDYYQTLRGGAPIYYDAPLQISKVNMFIGGHLSLIDPYFGYHGVSDPRYSANLIDALQAAIAGLFHATAVKVWYYSGAFFRLLFSLGLFSLAWEYLPKNRKQWAYAILPLAAFFYPTYFLYSELPDRIALVWTASLLLALKVWYERGQVGWVLLACLLIDCTHAINSLMAISFLGLIGLGMAILQVGGKRQLLELTGAIVLLAAALLLQLFYPNHISDDKLYFNAGPISGMPLIFRNYGPFKLSSLQWPASLWSTLYMALTAALAYGLKFLKTWPLRALGILAVLAGILLGYNPALLSMVAVAYLYRRLNSRTMRFTLIALSVYFGLLVYDPLFLHFAVGRIPRWLISRFDEFNMLAFVTPIIGGLVLLTHGPLKWSCRRLSGGMVYVAVPLFLLALSLHHHVVNLQATALQSHNFVLNNAYYQNVLDLQAIGSAIKGQTVFQATGNPLSLPMVVKANVSSMGYRAVNGSPMSNSRRRVACNSELEITMRQVDLQAAGITAVVLEKPIPQRLRPLISRPYLRLTANTVAYQVYRVQTDPRLAINPSNVCAIPYGQ